MWASPAPESIHSEVRIMFKVLAIWVLYLTSIPAISLSPIQLLEKSSRLPGDAHYPRPLKKSLELPGHVRCPRLQGCAWLRYLEPPTVERSRHYTWLVR